MASWYNEIVNDIRQLPNFISYYSDELIQAKQEVKLTGNLDKNIAALPGQVEQRFGQLQEIEAVLEFLNIQLRKIKKKHFQKYLEAYARALSSREAEKYSDSEQEVIDYECLINEVALIRNQYLGISKSFEVKNWMISNYTKLRVAGLDDITI